MAYSFRIPIWLPPDQRLIYPAKELDLSRQGSIRIYLRADATETFDSANKLTLRGDGFQSSQAAEADATLWLEWVSLAFVDLMIGADFGTFRSSTVISAEELLLWTVADPSHTHLGEQPGILTYATQTKPVYYALTGDGISGKYAEDLVTRALRAQLLGARLTNRLALARDLYSVAMFLPTDESRFIALMSAVESLIDQRPRPRSVISLIDSLIQSTFESTIETDEKDRLGNALGGLKRESINSAGRRLSQVLGANKYLDMEPPKFWAWAYSLRSKMSHGSPTAETMKSIRLCSPSLQWFIRDLILELSRSVDQAEASDGSK